MDAIVSGMLMTKIRQGNTATIFWYMCNRIGWKDTPTSRSASTSLRRSFEEVLAELKNRNLQVELFEPPKLIEVNLREAAYQRRATRNRQDVA